MKIEKRLRDFLHLKSTKHFVHCKKALILRNLAEFCYSVKFVSPYKFSTVYNMLNIYISYSRAVWGSCMGELYGGAVYWSCM